MVDILARDITLLFIPLVNHHRDIGFFMQAGFAFLKVGRRSKNATHVYMKIVQHR